MNDKNKVSLHSKLFLFDLITFIFSFTLKNKEKKTIVFVFDASSNEPTYNISGCIPVYSISEESVRSKEEKYRKK